jgi:hypothetical protein
MQICTNKIIAAIQRAIVEWGSPPWLLIMV